MAVNEAAHSSSADSVYGEASGRSNSESGSDSVITTSSAPHSQISSDPAIHLESSSSTSSASNVTSDGEPMRPSHSDGNLLERFRRSRPMASLASGLRKSFSLGQKKKKDGKKAVLSKRRLTEEAQVQTDPEMWADYVNKMTEAFNARWRVANGDDNLSIVTFSSITGVPFSPSVQEYSDSNSSTTSNFTRDSGGDDVIYQNVPLSVPGSSKVTAPPASSSLSSAAEKRSSSWLNRSPMSSLMMNCCLRRRTDSMVDVSASSAAGPTSNNLNLGSIAAVSVSSPQILANALPPPFEVDELAHPPYRDVSIRTAEHHLMLSEDRSDDGGRISVELAELLGLPLPQSEPAVSAAEARAQRERDFYLEEAADESEALFRTHPIQVLYGPLNAHLSMPPRVDVDEDDDIGQLRRILAGEGNGGGRQQAMSTFSHPNHQQQNQHQNHQLVPPVYSNYPLHNFGGGGNRSAPASASAFSPYPPPAVLFRPSSNNHQAEYQQQQPTSSRAVNPNALMAHPSSVHTQIDYINCLVPDLKAIAACSFYWGKMDRYEAERLLEGKPEGTFLLRDSAQEDHLFSVSFRRFDRSLHARIEQFKHRFSFDSHDPGVYSSLTVTGLIEHYKDPSHCMFFEPMLTKPLNRSFVFSLQHLARATVCDRLTSYQAITDLPLPPVLKAHLRQYHFSIKVRTKHFDEFTAYYQ